VKGSIPPASSIFIIIDVPERGSPETTMTGAPYLRRRIRRPTGDTQVLYQMGKR
jgi:hypothetical protein